MAHTEKSFQSSIMADMTTSAVLPVARRAAGLLLRLVKGRALPGAAALVILTGFVAACGFGDSPAFQTYKAFVNASVRGECETLYGLAEKDAVAYVDNLCKRRSIILMGQTVDLGSIASNVAGIRPTSTPFNDPISMERTIESEIRSPDKKTVDLIVLEKSFQRKGSVLEPTWLMRHTVTAQLSNGQWKLTRFNEEILHKYEEGETAQPAASGKQTK
jgi:hypothetical protein